MTSMIMDSREAIDRGLARRRGRRRRYWSLMGGSMLLLTIDLLWMWSNGDLPRDFAHLPHDTALGIACGYALGVAIGLVFVLRQKCDEHEIRARMVAMAVAFMAVILVYPPWAVLAGAGIVAAVSPFALWAGGFALFLATYVWRKYR